MKYFVYFDGYGHARSVIDEKDLMRKYGGDPEQFLRAMSDSESDADTREVTGHVGTLSFDNELELKEYLESCGDVVTGFFECESDSRPYNF